MNNAQLQGMQNIAEGMGITGEYEVVIYIPKIGKTPAQRIVKAFGLPYERACAWAQYWKGSVVEKEKYNSSIDVERDIKIYIESCNQLE